MPLDRNCTKNSSREHVVTYNTPLESIRQVSRQDLVTRLNGSSDQNRATRRESREQYITRESNTSRIPLRVTESDDFLRGDCVPISPVRALSALYRPTFSKYPSFPSIYKTKYQRDFEYIPFPIPSSFKMTPAKMDNSGFKIGNTSYTDDFHSKDIPKKPVIVPESRHRRNNPHPSIQFAQNYPNHVQFIWKKLEDRSSSKDGSLPNMSLSHEPRWHRWNSR